MTPVELSPTLVSRLGALESHVLDPRVTEVLVAGPNSVWVTRDGRTSKLDLRFDEGAIRSLASRLTRTLAWRESRTARTGLIGPELHVSIVGTPRGERCPVIRFGRRTVPRRTLEELAASGMLDRDVELRLLQACRGRRSIVISGHPGSGRTDLLAALARVWREERRVAVLDARESRLSMAEIGHVTLEPAAGAEGAAMLGAEVIVADDPHSDLWAELLGFGRPFIATVEAADAQAALDRIVAYYLQARAETSPVAGMALVESGIHLVVELERAHGRPLVRSLSEPHRSDGHLAARQIMRVPDLPPEASALLSVAAPPRAPTPPRPREPTQSFPIDGFGFETSDISEIRAESLMSASFVGQLPLPPTPAEERPESPPAEKKHPERGGSERLPTLIGREEKRNSEDETLPPDEMTMNAEAAEMTAEGLSELVFDDPSFTSPSTKGLDDVGWHGAPSEVTASPSLEDDPDETENKEFQHERTPYNPFGDKNGDRSDSISHDEIEGMLSELDDVVDMGGDDDPKVKRRTRRVR